MSVMSVKKYRRMLINDACYTLQLRASSREWIDEEYAEATRIVQELMNLLNPWDFDSFMHRCGEAEAMLRCGWRPESWKDGAK